MSLWITPLYPSTNLQTQLFLSGGVHSNDAKPSSNISHNLSLLLGQLWGCLAYKSHLMKGRLEGTSNVRVPWECKEQINLWKSEGKTITKPEKFLTRRTTCRTIYHKKWCLISWQDYLSSPCYKWGVYANHGTL